MPLEDTHSVPLPIGFIVLFGDRWQRTTWSADDGRSIPMLELIAAIRSAHTSRSRIDFELFESAAECVGHREIAFIVHVAPGHLIALTVAPFLQLFFEIAVPLTLNVGPRKQLSSIVFVQHHGAAKFLALAHSVIPDCIALILSEFRLACSQSIDIGILPRTTTCVGCSTVDAKKS